MASPEEDIATRLQDKHIICVIGAPSSGMTVHSASLAKAFGATLISMHALWENASPSSMKEASADDIAALKLGLVVEALLRAIGLESRRIIIDGFPLSMKEARLFFNVLDGHGSIAVLYLPGQLFGLRRHERTKSIDGEAESEYVARMKKFDDKVRLFDQEIPQMLQLLDEQSIPSEEIIESRPERQTRSLDRVYNDAEQKAKYLFEYLEE